MTLRIKQASAYQGGEWWSWSVWLDGPAEELAQVKSVTYHLHPTFPDPERTVTDRRRKFRLDAAGWGEFRLGVTIRRKDGTTLKRSRDLKLERPPDEIEGDEPIRIFLSYSIADADIGNAIEQALEGMGIETVTAKDIGAAAAFAESLQELIERAEAAVVIVSDVKSRWVGEEAALLRERGVPVVPVVVGGGTALPGPLSDLQSFRVIEEKDIPAVAAQVAAAIRSQVRSR